MVTLSLPRRLIGPFLAITIPVLMTASVPEGEGPLIAVIDSGIDPTVGVFDGRVEPGYDFVVDDDEPTDRSGHGTEMAAIIAGRDRGSCPVCRILPLRVAKRESGVDQTRIAAAIDRAVAEGADIVYVGAGAVGANDRLRTSVREAVAAGTLIVAPAGSEEVMQTLRPAALPDVVSVVASDGEGRFLRTSNTTGRETVAASGATVEVVSLGGNTVRRSGSSVAAARVAGIAGRILSETSDLDVRQVRQILHHGVIPMEIPGWSEYFDYGRLSHERVWSRTASDFTDLAVTRLTVEPTRPHPGQVSYARARVTNRGNVSTPPTRLRVEIDGVPVEPFPSVPALDLGEVIDLDVRLPPSSTRESELRLRLESVPSENAPENDVASRIIEYTDDEVRDVDLIVGELSEPVVEADSLSLPVTIRNRGNRMERGIVLRLTVDHEIVVEQRYDLDAGSRVRDVISWSVPEPGLHVLRVEAIPSGMEEAPEEKVWWLDVLVARRGDPGRLQYADTDGITDVIMDAPWRTMRDYLPVLYFLPQFPTGSRRVDEILLTDYDPVRGEAVRDAVIFQDLREGGLTACDDASIIDPSGTPRGDIDAGETFDNFWHYIVRVPVPCIGLRDRAGEPGLHYLQAEVEWSKVVLFWRFHWTYSRVLRVDVDPDPLPRFDELDRYYDAHVHTIAEQTTTSRFDVDGPNKAFGGPIALLLEASYAIGMVDAQLDRGNWPDFRDRVVVTDHNVFYSSRPYDPPSAPGYGPTARTDGHLGEHGWYRRNLGELAGEEVTLRRGSNQDGSLALNLGHHLLAYASDHMEGPWHGGVVLTSRLENPLDVLTALRRMRSSEGSAFGYAAHPDAADFAWPDEHFAQAIGFAPHNRMGGPQLDGAGTDYQFKGSQVWNAKSDSVSRSVSTGDLEAMNPFPGGPEDQRFEENRVWDDAWSSWRGWERELVDSFESYAARLAEGLVHAFAETPKSKFIRKIYMSAGTDAHGDFNYTDDVQSTLSSTWAKATMSTNAYGRVRTYTLVHDRAGYDGERSSHDAYRDGNTVLTDGPLCRFALDSDGRHDTRPGARPRWHDGTEVWENGEGRIGGSGVLDGERTTLVPEGGDSRMFIETEWLASATAGARGIDRLELIGIDESGRSPPAPLPAGPSGSPVRRALPNKPANVWAYVLHGHDRSVDERCITNPIWSVPVPIEIRHPPVCPIPAGALTARFRFPISMDGSRPLSVHLEPLDGQGDSRIGGKVDLRPAPGWSEAGGVEDGEYAATNPAPIPCPAGGWDARVHAPDPDRRSYVIYADDPRDGYGNIHNDIGRTFVVTRADVPEGDDEDEENGGDDEGEPEAAALPTSVSTVGLVMPARAGAGERVSGSVVLDPERFEDVPGLRVVRVEVPVAVDDADNPTLRGLRIQAGGAAALPARDGFTFVIPDDTDRVPFIVRRSESRRPVSRIDVPVIREPVGTPIEAFETPAAVVAGAVGIVRGPFDGVGGTTRIEVGGRTVPVLAETPGAVFWHCPEDLATGSTRLRLEEGGAGVELPVNVVGLRLSAEKLQLGRGESTRLVAVVSGFGDPPAGAGAWGSGLAEELVNVDRVRELVPGFEVPSAEERGEILLVLENASRNTISLEHAREGVVVLRLAARDFELGRYRFEAEIRARRRGGFVIHALVIPLVQPVGPLAR